MSKFNVGDMVRVRDWEDMFEEFGYYKDTGDIPCDSVFVCCMKDFCGGVYTIISAFDTIGGHRGYYLEGCGGENGEWEFSDDMLRLVKRAGAPKIEPIQASVLFAFSNAGVEIEEEYAITTVETCEYDYSDEEKKGMIQALADYLEVEIDFPTRSCPVEDETEDAPLETINEEKKELYNGKVVCLKGGAGLTAGKIYNIIDGGFIDDDGEKRPMDNFLICKDDPWFTNGIFIPLVEG